jgi:hypothetical protein
MAPTTDFRRPDLARVLLVGTAVVAAVASASCGTNELDRAEARRIVEKHVSSLGPSTTTVIPLVALLEPTERLELGPNEHLDLLLMVPANTPPDRWAKSCSRALQEHGTRVFQSVNVEAGWSSMNVRLGAMPTWQERVEFLLRDPITPEVLEITGIVPHPIMASARVVEYTWGYPVPDGATAIRCRVVRTRPSSEESAATDAYDVLCKQPRVTPRAGKVTLSLYDDGWRVVP